jgi:hypothetical protein
MRSKKGRKQNQEKKQRNKEKKKEGRNQKTQRTKESKTDRLKESKKERNKVRSGLSVHPEGALLSDCLIASQHKTSPRLCHCFPPQPCYEHRLLTPVWIRQFIGTTKCVCSAACEMSAHSCSHSSKEIISPWVLRSRQRPGLHRRFSL